MPSNPDKLIIRAMIPNEAQPPKYVLDQGGLPPEVILANESTVEHEDEFKKIGADIVGAELKIAKQDPDRAINTKVGWATITAIKSEAINHEAVTLKEGYSWKTLG